MDVEVRKGMLVHFSVSFNNVNNATHNILAALSNRSPNDTDISHRSRATLTWRSGAYSTCSSACCPWLASRITPPASPTVVSTRLSSPLAEPQATRAAEAPCARAPPRLSLGPQASALPPPLHALSAAGSRGGAGGRVRIGFLRARATWPTWNSDRLRPCACTASASSASAFASTDASRRRSAAASAASLRRFQSSEAPIVSAGSERDMGV